MLQSEIYEHQLEAKLQAAQQQLTTLQWFKVLKRHTGSKHEHGDHIAAQHLPTNAAAKQRSQYHEKLTGSADLIQEELPEHLPRELAAAMPSSSSPMTDDISEEMPTGAHALHHLHSASQLQSISDEFNSQQGSRDGSPDASSIHSYTDDFEPMLSLSESPPMAQRRGDSYNLLGGQSMDRLSVLSAELDQKAQQLEEQLKQQARQQRLQRLDQKRQQIAKLQQQLDAGAVADDWLISSVGREQTLSTHADDDSATQATVPEEQHGTKSPAMSVISEVCLGCFL